MINSKINTKTDVRLILALSLASIGLAALYMWSAVAFDFFGSSKPDSLGDLFVTYANLSIPLLIPAFLFTLGVFYPIYKSKNITRNKISVTLIGLAFALAVWIVYCFAFFLVVAKFVRVLGLDI